MSVRGSAISSAKQGKSGFIYNLVKINKLFWPRNVRAFHEIPNRIHTELTFMRPFKSIITKCIFVCRPLKYLKPHRLTVWTRIKLLLQEQSDLGHIVCLYAYVK